MPGNPEGTLSKKETRMNKPSLHDLLQRIAVWNKGYPIVGENPAVWRNDCFGNRICWHDYGDRTSIHGWEEDHIVVKAVGGSDEVYNLRPLHWKKNASLGGGLGQLVKDWPAPKPEEEGGLFTLLSGGLYSSARK